jgi:hypothetical protein
MPKLKIGPHFIGDNNFDQGIDVDVSDEFYAWAIECSSPKTIQSPSPIDVPESVKAEMKEIQRKINSLHDSPPWKNVK